jgi:hypothetical protein
LGLYLMFDLYRVQLRQGYIGSWFIEGSV